MRQTATGMELIQGQGIEGACTEVVGARTVYSAENDNASKPYDKECGRPTVREWKTETWWGIEVVPWVTRHPDSSRGVPDYLVFQKHNSMNGSVCVSWGMSDVVLFLIGFRCAEQRCRT